MTPLCERMCLGQYNYSLSDGWHGTLHHRERKRLPVTNTAPSLEILLLEVASNYFLTVYWEGLWHHHK